VNRTVAGLAAVLGVLIGLGLSGPGSGQEAVEAGRAGAAAGPGSDTTAAPVVQPAVQPTPERAAAPLARPQRDGTNAPGPDTTGVPGGVKLRSSGPITVSQPGTVIEDLEIRGALEIAADDVTVRRCRILGGGYWGIRVLPGTTGTLVEDSEIIPQDPSPDVDAIRAEGGFTGRRLKIAGTADGVKAGSGTRLEASWIHDLATGPDTHNDAVQVLGGSDIAIVGNRLEGASNAAVMVSTEFGPVDGLLLEGNWLDGGGYTLNLRGGPHGEPTRLRVLANRFGRGFSYGPAVVDGPLEASGNVWDDTGEAVAL
jgi:hypothetical protein